jgi:hypothetical protein
MESPSVYLALLIDVGRNSATFALDTIWVCKSTDDAERREASLLIPDKLGEVMYEIDRCANRIEQWKQLYLWLGMKDGPQWAAFTKESALRLVPHWFTEYECQRSGLETFAYVDRKCRVDPRLLRDLKVEGNTTEANAMRYSQMFGDNLVVTTQPLFL